MNNGIYLYCIADGNEKTNLGKIGIDGNEVYSLPYQQVSAIVHNCESRAYESEDKDIVKMLGKCGAFIRYFAYADIPNWCGWMIVLESQESLMI